MMHFFMRWAIGGETGKRESAWFVFLLWLAATVWIAYAEFATDRAVEAALSMWMVATPFVFAWLAAAHGFQWVSQQTSWGGSPYRPAVYRRPEQPDLFDPLPTRRV